MINFKLSHKVIVGICRRISNSDSIDETQWEAAMSEYKKSNNITFTEDFEKQFFDVISENISCSPESLVGSSLHNFITLPTTFMFQCKEAVF